MLQTSERLATLDEFGTRKFVVPADVKGKFRKWRTHVYKVLLAIFLILPWIKINGLQAVWLDIPNRHFEIFGGLFLAHDVPLLFLLLVMLALGLMIMTALFGRVWCGWACPQTVFIDMVYRRIEAWVEGPYIERRRLRAEPFSMRKLRLTVIKWALFIAASSVIAHSFIAYFSGADNLLKMIQGSPGDHWSYFLIVSAVTGVLAFNFGWFREQFCFVMCPYGRFQSVLMDPATVTVLYDEKRGEPRKGLAAAAESAGDCVACNRCVQVCPTGIDIRKGVQLECIACTACIDACDEIMRKVHKPENLIGYHSMSGTKARFLRPRVLALSGLALACLVSLLVILSQREPFAVNILRAHDTPYQTLPEGTVLNHFKVHLLNQSRGDEQFTIAVPPELASLGVKLTLSAPLPELQSGESREAHFFLSFPREILSADGDKNIELIMTESHSGTLRRKAVTIVGPAR